MVKELCWLMLGSTMEILMHLERTVMFRHMPSGRIPTTHQLAHLRLEKPRRQAQIFNSHMQVHKHASEPAGACPRESYCKQCLPLLPVQAFLLLAANEGPPLCLALLKECQHYLQKGRGDSPQAEPGGGMYRVGLTYMWSL